jgi:hypothetical protein
MNYLQNYNERKSMSQSGNEFPVGLISAKVAAVEEMDITER